MTKPSQGRPFRWSQWLQSAAPGLSARGDDGGLKPHPFRDRSASGTDRIRFDREIALGAQWGMPRGAAVGPDLRRLRE